MSMKNLQYYLEMITTFDDEYWDHDAVGEDGSISKYVDGLQSVSFFVKQGKWKYKARLHNYDKSPGYGQKTLSGDLSSEDSDAFDEGDETLMTEVAKKILGT